MRTVIFYWRNRCVNLYFYRKNRLSDGNTKKFVIPQKFLEKHLLLLQCNDKLELINMGNAKYYQVWNAQGGISYVNDWERKACDKR